MSVIIVVLVCLVAGAIICGLGLLVVMLQSELKALKKQVHCTHQTRKCTQCGLTFHYRQPSPAS